MQRYPEAGQAFWAVRVWTNITWQPVYLAVISIHTLGVLPDLSGLTQKAEGIHVDGYRLLPGTQRQGPVMELIDIAGAELRGMADAMLAEINALTRLKPVPARRLLADRLLGLMVRLGRMRPDLPAATIRAYADRWLAAMGLTGQGDLETLTLQTGRETVIIARKGCCLDYLIAAGDYCTSCPKQKDAVRRARQRADAEAAFG